jgi:hypothetical protein
MKPGANGKETALKRGQAVLCFRAVRPRHLFYPVNESMRDLKLRFGALGSSLLFGVFSLFG